MGKSVEWELIEESSIKMYSNLRRGQITAAFREVPSFLILIFISAVTAVAVFLGLAQLKTGLLPVVGTNITPLGPNTTGSIAINATTTIEKAINTNFINNFGLLILLPVLGLIIGSVIGFLALRRVSQ